MPQSIPDSLRAFEPFWDHWTITAHIDDGGYGNVYRITRTDIPSDSSVANAALKWIPIPKDEAEIDGMAMKGMSEESIQRLNNAKKDICLSEIELMGRFKGRGGIVSYEDFFVHPRENGKGYDIFIRMELMKETLFERLRRERLDAGEVMRVARDMLAALKDCHEAGVIHRDIKPENIFIASNGAYKLGDFGIARQLDQNGQVLAAASGSSMYVAPEVVSGDVQTPATDLYALGLILYHLTNDNLPPFASGAGAPTPEEEAQLQERRLSGEALKKPRRASDALWSVIQKACAFAPEKRYQSAEEMLAALCAADGSAKPVPAEKAPSKNAAPKPAYEARRAETVAVLRKQLSRAGDKPPEEAEKAGAHRLRKPLLRASAVCGALGALLLLVYAVTLFTAAVPAAQSATATEIAFSWNGGASEGRVEYAPKGVSARETAYAENRALTLSQLIPDTLYAVRVYNESDLILQSEIATLSAPAYQDARFKEVAVTPCAYAASSGTLNQVIDKQDYKALKEDDRYPLTLRDAPMDAQETRYCADVKYSFAGERTVFPMEYQLVLRLPGDRAYRAQFQQDSDAKRMFHHILDFMPLFDAAYRDLPAWTGQNAELEIYIDGMLFKTYDIEIIVPDMNGK